MNLSVAAAISAIIAALGASAQPPYYPEEPLVRLRYPRPPNIHDTKNYTCEMIPDNPWLVPVQRARDYFNGPTLELCGNQHEKKKGHCTTMYRFTDDAPRAFHHGVRVVACGTRDTTCWDVADMLDALIENCKMYVNDHTVVGGSHWYGHGLVRDSYIWIGTAHAPEDHPPRPGNFSSINGTARNYHWVRSV